MEHMTLRNSGIYYSITIFERITHLFIDNLLIYILLFIGIISDATVIFQMLLLYTFIVPFEGFTFPHVFPRIHWIQRHFFTTIIGCIWSTHLYKQAQCAAGNSNFRYIFPIRMYIAPPVHRQCCLTSIHQSTS